jgi:YD repeat-containing protein
VDIQWPGVTDDTNGTGVAFYSVYRNGSFMADVEAPSTTYSDTTVSAGTSYSYQIYAYDYHLNSVNTTIGVTSAPTGAIDPRRVGMRPTAEYWGANPEQIDMLSGNLNFSVPFLNAMGRGGANGSGWTAGFSLSYNSQNWRNDPGGNWNLGRDVGYGYGWKLLAGSLTPAWSGYFTLDHYTFTDASGAEYRLTLNTGGVWTSTESNYVSYNSATQTLYFRDGMSWIMGSVSAGSEQDSGTLYPTVIQDTNPSIPNTNNLTISYMAGSGLSASNSSSRIYQITDVRGTAGPTYTFNYTTVSGSPHLNTITNSIGTGEAYSFGMTTQALVSPFDGTSFGNEVILGNVNVTNIPGTQQTFTYDTSGELTESVMPKGGYLAWAYGSFTYSGSRIQREVQTRYLSKDGTLGSQTGYPITHEASDGLHTVHAWAILDDPGGIGEKYWAFSQSGANLGLTTQYQGRQLPGPVVQIQNDYTWVQDSAGNNYIGTVLITHGNVTQSQIYNYGNLTTPARTYNYTYLGSGTGESFYPAHYIFNRVNSATVTEGSTTVTLVTNGYDGRAIGSGATVTGPGRVTSSVNLSGTQAFTRDPVSGGVVSATNNGLTTSVTINSTTNYAAPSQITVGSLNQTMTYNSFLGLSNETAPNSVTASFTYDSAARPSTSVSPYGITTYYTYPTLTTAASYSTISDPWTLTTSDGFGRTISVATGAGTYY